MDPEPVDEVENSTVRFNDTRTNTGCLDVKMINMLQSTPCDAEDSMEACKRVANQNRDLIPPSPVLRVFSQR